MSSSLIVGYAIFCIIVFFLVNRLFRKKKTNAGEEKVPAVSKIETKQPEQNASNIVELEATKKEAVEPDVRNMKKEASKKHLPIENVNVKAVVTVLILGMFVSILNQTIINVALPPLMNEFNVSTSTAQWLITGFMLVNGILVPISAFLVSRFTYRNLFIAAMVFFTVGSIICAISGNFTMMMIGRVIQAVGAGILMPIGMNIFMTLFPPHKRGAAMGLLGVAMILAPAIGPTVTGWVIENYSWNLMFYAMFVIGLIITLLSLKFFTLAQPVSKAKLDSFGVISSSIGLGSLLYGFSEAGNNSWSSAEVVVSLIIGTIGLALFIWREMTTDNKMLDLHVFKYPTFTFTLLINAIVTMALFGGMLLLPVYLQNIRGFTPIESGLLLLPGSLIMGIMGPIAGKLFDKYGIRPLAIIGLAITTYATYEFTKLTMDTPYSVIMRDYIIRSIGMSFIMMPIMTAGMNALPMKLISHGTATQNTSRQVAGSIGTAILITIMTQQTNYHVADYGNMLTTTNPILVDKVHGMGQSLAALAGSAQAGDAMSTQLLYGQISKLSAINGINDAFLIATILAGIAWILSFFLKSGNKPNRKAGN
ncbi:DHA2 family efflux MFS transporter permease subunit [Bacillus cytotoxicus]|uniref:DHA2 family efflux MFS transporter permease subunit n=1 Tax=Bacillus cereus group sp. BfR-BA-01492 TaxID=2920361 RepID=UPI001F58ABEC|nr:DHA2 family efflux MFS transporter permease subunit [Bacillus cereus group sp. BfR-BA-01492]EMA6342709.1 DHA2 family efflux MFS transporter permease subunit [Bacillus cytotoxicus]